MKNEKEPLGGPSPAEVVTARFAEPVVAGKHLCEGTMWGGSTWHRYRKECGKRAKFEREGKWYCGSHDPVTVSAKQAARNAEFDRKWSELRERERVEKAAPDMLEALRAVDRLWSTDAIEFAAEMHSGSPVGVVWAKLRAAIAKAEGK